MTNQRLSNDEKVKSLIAVELSESKKFYRSLRKAELINHIVSLSTYINTQQILLRELQSDNERKHKEILEIKDMYDEARLDQEKAVHDRYKVQKELAEKEQSEINLQDGLNKNSESQIEMILTRFKNIFTK
ncbi:hypothetical protein [Enterococcus sp. DIV0187]|uniref:hypothetical protein n=1 Tax=Enterococcus sp. DIV0187 TaxID=2774644 RepID=UPI003F291F3C